MPNISSKTTDYNPDYVLEKLDDAIAIINSNIKCYCSDPLRDFTRNRFWTPDKIIRFLVQMESKSMKSELCSFFDSQAALPTDSSLCQQRQKLHPDALNKVLYLFTRFFHYDNTFKGYYLLAADGSDINIAHDKNDRETAVSNGTAEYSQYHVNALYDCLNHVYWNVNIDTASKKRETEALRDMIIDHAHPVKSIITADRGYESYNLIACCNRNNQKFVIRVKDKSTRSGILSNIDLPDGESDTIVRKVLTRKQTKETKSNRSKYALLMNDSKFDYLDIDKDYYEIEYRVVRIKLSDGSYECLITNLSQDEFSIEDLKKIYHLRWNIETSFRKLKYTIGLTNFHSKKRAFIKQEIYARFILYNLSSIIAYSTKTKKKGKKHEMSLNYTLAVTNIRLYLNGRITESEVVRRIKKYLVPIRPDRSYPRNVKAQSNKSFNNRAA